MLDYSTTPEHFVITETTISWTTTKTMVVRYTCDLKKKQVNTDPWQDTTEADRAWFEKYYRKNFERRNDE